MEYLCDQLRPHTSSGWFSNVALGGIIIQAGIEKTMKELKKLIVDEGHFGQSNYYVHLVATATDCVGFRFVRFATDC